jgi:hypothetical protein
MMFKKKLENGQVSGMLYQKGRKWDRLLRSRNLGIRIRIIPEWTKEAGLCVYVMKM